MVLLVLGFYINEIQIYILCDLIFAHNVMFKRCIHIAMSSSTSLLL